MPAAIDHQIREFIGENFLFGEDPNRLAGDDSLVENGVIDSTGVMELVTFVGNTFKVSVPPEDILPDNFDSVQKLADYIKRKQS